ncbi:MAG: bifunctional phosphopantothenoylcysteine decarboxylase/phosphopantothenate synthase [Candidatus Vogelbacteria bacterium]|nr:bifunctional phosphopantothenoylcysteine decarboxylase/phosphopantothenate synthase [Candidatus Vogelbacteria bacterium]
MNMNFDTEVQMRVLITAGSTKTMVDEVRAIDNIFKGNTGVEIALSLGDWNDCEVTFLTSYKELYLVAVKDHPSRVTVKTYRTFDELLALMKDEICTGNYDVVIHSSAVSDYYTEGVYGTVSGDPESGLVLRELDRNGKIPSDNEELWIRLAKTEKIVDKIKKEWGYKGKLVMFKLQSKISDEELIEKATISMIRAKADLIVANCLQWYKERAYVISSAGSVQSILRSDLTNEIMKGVTTK